jgi:hypothetical protein
MARIKLFLIAVVAGLLGACAEIIPLTGGEQDTTAPKPLKQSPEQGAIYYSGNSVSMTFDEFLKLNDPANTIMMNPSVGKLTTEQKNKTVTVSWEEPLRPNTTYILQMNGAIRDLNEANDSIMQIVFATGSVIDSMSYQGRVVNAYSNQATAQVSVGLYAPGSDPFAVKPIYATRTDAKGIFQFSYLKDEPYTLFAFIDQNKDQLPQVNETIGFANDTISVSDTSEMILQVFTPIPVHNKLKVDFLEPGLMVAYNQDGVHAERLSINGESVELVKAISGDSILVTLPPAPENSRYQIVYGNDTIRRPLTQKERMIPLTIRPIEQNGKWQEGDSLLFRVNDKVTAINREGVHILTQKGSPVKYEIVQRAGEWDIVPDPTNTESYSIHFDKGAITGAFGVNDSITFKYETLLSADLSNLKLNCADLEGEWIIELVQAEKTIYSTVKPTGMTSVEFKAIVPGQYNVRCIHDRNGNGKWDPGSYITRSQAEEVLRYTLTQKLRANWDIEETLQRKL